MFDTVCAGRLSSWGTTETLVRARVLVPGASLSLDLNDFDASLLAGFSQGMTFAELRAERHHGPDRKPGVYAVVYPSQAHPKFLECGCGGWFRKKDPNVDIKELEKRWVPNSRVLYIGKAGAPNENVDLRDRISQFSRFGLGTNASHWGGRHIWQIEGSSELVVKWKPTFDQVPFGVEQRLLLKFASHYGRAPFANLKNGGLLARLDQAG